MVIAQLRFETYTNGEERDGLVDSSEGRDIDGLSSDGTLGSDSGRVFSGSGVDNGVDEDLDGVLLGDEVDDLESVLDDSDGHDLFTVVSAVHHQAVKSSVSVLCTETFPCIHTHALTRRSTMGIRPLANCFLAYRPAVWGT